MSLVHYSSDSEEEQVPQKRTLSSILTEPKKVVYVDLPKIEKEEEEEEEEKRKRPKTSVGFSLADLLPAPKNTNPFERTEAEKITLAQKIKEKKKESTPEPAPEPVEELEEETQKIEEEKIPKKHTGSFFHLGKDLKQEPIVLSKPKAIQPVTTGLVHTVERPKESSQPTVDYDYDPNAMYSTDPSACQYYQQYQQFEQVEEDNSEDLQQLMGHRMRGEHNIQFTTVNQSDILPTEEERATQLLTQAPVFDEGPGLTASKLQLKNNNIMALAAHAVNNREKLDSMFSEQKKTRRDAAKKYGF